MELDGKLQAESQEGPDLAVVSKVLNINCFSQILDREMQNALYKYTNRTDK